jgi:hypothetical protein
MALWNASRAAKRLVRRRTSMTSATTGLTYSAAAVKTRPAVSACAAATTPSDPNASTTAQLERA